MKYFRFLLFPFSILYYIITEIRNWLFDQGILRSFSLNVKTISVGNLTIGGTGKTPLVEYLIRLLKDRYNIVTLSRGYKRKTRGLVIARAQDTARTIGDEPAQFFMKYGKVIGVAVCEDRLYAIPHILKSRPETNLILLDDAYQQRGIRSTCNILLTDYNRPFYQDWLIPSGNLRESRRNADRADAIIITKCPPGLKEEEANNIRIILKKFIPISVPVFFMKTLYAEPVPLFDKNLKNTGKVILVTGIAQSKPLVQYVRQNYQLVYHFKFPDHHYYTNKDINKIRAYIHNKNLNNYSILFTEKDVARIRNTSIEDILLDQPVFFQPITYKFVHNGSEFDEFIIKVLEKTDI